MIFPTVHHRANIPGSLTWKPFSLQPPILWGRGEGGAWAPWNVLYAFLCQTVVCFGMGDDVNLSPMHPHAVLVLRLLRVGGLSPTRAMWSHPSGAVRNLNAGEGVRALGYSSKYFFRDVKFIKFIFCLQKKSLKYSKHIGRNNFEQFKGQNGNVCGFWCLSYLIQL